MKTDTELLKRFLLILTHSITEYCISVLSIIKQNQYDVFAEDRNYLKLFLSSSNMGKVCRKRLKNVFGQNN